MANIKFFFCGVLQNSLKIWVKCDYSEALHIEMHVHTSNLDTGNSHLWVSMGLDTTRVS